MPNAARNRRVARAAGYLPIITSHREIVIAKFLRFISGCHDATIEIIEGHRCNSATTKNSNGIGFSPRCSYWRFAISATCANLPPF